MNNMPSCVSVVRLRRAVSAWAIMSGAMTRVSVSAANGLSSSDTTILQCFFDLGEGGHGIRAQQSRGHDRAGDVAVLDDAHGFPTRQQTVHEHPAERVARTEAAHHFDEVRRNDGGSFGGGHHHTFGAHLDDGKLDTAVEQSTSRL